jgi:hypothetical protein
LTAISGRNNLPSFFAKRADPFLRHMIMRLPEERQAEFILMAPFTPRGKDNLAAWMVARNDGEHYGQLVVYRFPKQSLVFGPSQIVNRINQETEISRQVSLWDQRGSQVIRGNLLVIPIEESLIYVQPLYLRAAGRYSLSRLGPPRVGGGVACCSAGGGGGGVTRVASSLTSRKPRLNS